MMNTKKLDYESDIESDSGTDMIWSEGASIWCLNKQWYTNTLIQINKMYIIVINEIVILFAYPKLFSLLAIAENWNFENE